MAENKEVEKKDEDFIVEDPKVLQPKELPLVIKPAKGKEWKNKEQEEFATTLNGYAYKNPDKWATKKDALLAQLKAIGEDPQEIVKARGNATRVSFSNQLMQSAEDN